MNNYFAKYQAYNILKQSTDLDKLTLSIASSRIDFNPHQIYAALFAIKSPFSKGVMLADEVGLGKTIEAGLIVNQFFCSNKRNLLIICPASLRKQWQLELLDKFSLSSEIITTKGGFQNNTINICSYQFASNNTNSLKKIQWNLCILDEAHKIRNLHKKTKIAKNLADTLLKVKKILLSATPLQNSLQELHSLSHFIDNDIFGSLKSFQMMYGKGNNLEELKERIVPFIHRVLRKNVAEYIKYTERKSKTFNYIPSQAEIELYKYVDRFLRENNTYAIPLNSQYLLKLLIRKFLGSSTVALVSTMKTIKNRLNNLLNGIEDEDITKKITEENDYIIENDIEEIPKASKIIDKKELQREINELEKIINVASSIKLDNKTQELKKALAYGFKRMKELEANKKCVIFTESAKTQEYLAKWFKDNTEYNIVKFNGTNKDKEATEIYQKWVANPENSKKVTENKNADIRQALIDEFKDNGDILISTEAGSEGINLQFCSLVINYDLPWNPQRIEQRIGRCHRYGQKHDVVVINFINLKNIAEQRIYEILKEKFKLFDGVFGASDEILGNLEDGEDFERKIIDTFNSCRNEVDIANNFEELRLEFEDKIETNITKAKRELFDNFDEEIIAKFKGIDSDIKDKVREQQEDFWQLTKYIIPLSSHPLQKHYFNDELKIFGQEEYEVNYNTKAQNSAASFAYYLTSNKEVLDYQEKINKNPYLSKVTKKPYNITTKEGQVVLEYAKGLDTNKAIIEFNYSKHKSNIVALDNEHNRSGVLKVSLEKHYNFDDLFLIGVNEKGEVIAKDILEKLFKLDSRVLEENIEKDVKNKEEILEEEYNKQKEVFKTKAENNINKLMSVEISKVEAWEKDKKLELETEIQKLELERDDLYREIKNIQNPMERMKLNRERQVILDKIFKIGDKNTKLRQKIEKERDNKMNELEDFVKKDYETKNLFTIKWKII